MCFHLLGLSELGVARPGGPAFGEEFQPIAAEEFAEPQGPFSFASVACFDGGPEKEPRHQEEKFPAARGPVPMPFCHCDEESPAERSSEPGWGIPDCWHIVLEFGGEVQGFQSAPSSCRDAVGWWIAMKRSRAVGGTW